MFGKTNKREGNSTVIALDLHTTSPGEKRPAIVRNHKKDKKGAGMNIYHRADQIFMRSKISEFDRLAIFN